MIFEEYQYSASMQSLYDDSYLILSFQLLNLRKTYISKTDHWFIFSFSYFPPTLPVLISPNLETRGDR